ncbi:unnamed protein product [Boreogadus saida]
MGERGEGDTVDKLHLNPRSTHIIRCGPPGWQGKPGNRWHSWSQEGTGPCSLHLEHIKPMFPHLQYREPRYLHLDGTDGAPIKGLVVVYLHVSDPDHFQSDCM